MRRIAADHDAGVADRPAVDARAVRGGRDSAPDSAGPHFAMLAQCLAAALAEYLRDIGPNLLQLSIKAARAELVVLLLPAGQLRGVLVDIGRRIRAQMPLQTLRKCVARFERVRHGCRYLVALAVRRSARGRQ